MHRQLEPGPVASNRLWHFPVVVVIAIYLPAGLWGAYVFRDSYATSMLGLLALFAALYYALYPQFARALRMPGVRSFLWRIGDRIHWRSLAWLAVAAYIAALCVAALTIQATPLAIALKGGNLHEIAAARADFLVNREGPWAVLRYLAVILGRAVMPFLVTYCYWSNHRARHAALGALLICYLVPLEKASPLFAFLPLIVLRGLQANWKAVAAHLVSLIACIGLWTFLALGTLHGPKRPTVAETGRPAAARQAAVPADPAAAAITRHGDPRRHFVFNFFPSPHHFQRGRYSVIVDQMLWIVNRVAWIPYVTAYDWLKFHDDVLGGKLTLGRQIGIFSRLTGSPRLDLERMVYQYQYGASPGQGGASNTVFLVDAKLAFGWIGVLAYCVAFTLFAAIVFTSANPVAQIAGTTSFFTAALSPLTATLLSGGLFFYLAIALLTRLEPHASSLAQARS